MRRFLNTVFFVIAVLLVVIFALSNAENVRLNILGRLLPPVPISLLTLVAFLLGVVLASLLNLVEKISLKREVKRLRKELSGRNAPIKQKEAPDSPKINDHTESGSGNP